MTDLHDRFTAVVADAEGGRNQLASLVTVSDATVCVRALANWLTFVEAAGGFRRTGDPRITHRPIYEMAHAHVTSAPRGPLLELTAAAISAKAEVTNAVVLQAK